MAKHVHRRRRRAGTEEAPTLSEGQQVMEVCSVRGQGLFVLRNAAGDKALYELPGRLRHAALLKPGAYVFARPDATRIRAGGSGKVRGDIEVVVLEHHLPAVRKAKYWPPEFALARVADDAGGDIALPADDDIDDDLPAGGNPNRAHWSMYHESTSEEEEEVQGDSQDAR